MAFNTLVLARGIRCRAVCRPSPGGSRTCQMSGVRCQMSCVRCQMTDVRCLMSVAKISDVRCQMSDIRYQISDVHCKKTNQKYLKRELNIDIFIFLNSLHVISLLQYVARDIMSALGGYLCNIVTGKESTVVWHVCLRNTTNTNLHQTFQRSSTFCALCLTKLR